MSFFVTIKSCKKDRQRFFVFFVSFILLLVAGWAAPVQAETWQVASDDNLPPYNFSLRGKRVGLNVEIVEAILKSIGVTPLHRALSWTEVLASLENDDIDIAFHLVGTKERFARYHMIGPLRIGTTVFMARKEDTIHFQQLEDLKGLVIGVVRGFAYTEEFDKADFLDKLPASSNLTNIRRLLLGRVDLVVGDMNMLQYLATQDGRMKDLQFLPKELGRVPRYLAMPKSRSSKAERVQEAFTKLEQQGVIKKIIQSWLHDE
ncbi:MAG: amino acid ABC transporter substrate-binding protein [Magnetococcales bacterium]|nr:amino acid ABC transporter substrate-binding protein [Magnetococcales bacterium]